MTKRRGFFLTWFVALVFGGVALASNGKLRPIKEFFEPEGDYPASEYAKVAVVQWAPTLDTPLEVSKSEALEFKKNNWRSLEQYIREAAENGAQLIVTPEFATLGYPDIPGVPAEDDEYRSREDIEPYVETVPGPATRYFGKIAKELGVYIHIGLAEVDPDTDEYFNTVVAIDPRGRIAAKYRKQNLYEGEIEFLSSGWEIATYDAPFGRVGIIICADVYSSSPMDDYRYEGVDVLALSTSWAQWNTGMSVFRQGARENEAYLLAANQTYFPDSGVVNPDGSLQSHIRQSTGIAYGYLPLRY